MAEQKNTWSHWRDDITREGCLKAIDELRANGRDAFLEKYGYRYATEYYLHHEGNRYDSKAIVGVARKFDRPELGPASSKEFSGGKDAAAGRAQELGFTVPGVPNRSKEGRSFVFGPVPGVKLGQSFHNRTELSKALVHPPTQAGIAGNQSDGAASSIVLNGGYEDDEDDFEEIVYTGHGGRDESTGRQVSDQTLTKQNLHLARSSDLDVPVRVTRGPKAGEYAPSSGYRYDGLYTVERYWPKQGKSGFLVWRFKLVALDTYDFSPDSQLPSGSPSPERKPRLQNVIARDHHLANSLRQMHNYTCQFCSTRLNTLTGPVANAAHIVPLGAPDNGPDIPKNMLCLCPNCHSVFDRGGLIVTEDGFVFDTVKHQRLNPLMRINRHSVDQQHLAVHREKWFIDQPPSSIEQSNGPGRTPQT